MILGPKDRVKINGVTYRGGDEVPDPKPEKKKAKQATIETSTISEVANGRISISD